MSYTDIHRSVLRTFVREIAIEEKSLLRTIANLTDISHDAPSVQNNKDLDLFMEAINGKLDHYAMHLQLVKRRAWELDDKMYWVLVNRKNDDISCAFASGLKDVELIAFKEILKQLAKSEYGNLLLKEVKLKDAKTVDKRSLVKKLVEDKWLVWDAGSQGKFTAGVRTLAELDKDLCDLGAFVWRGKAVLRTKALKAMHKRDEGKDMPLEDGDEDDENGDEDDENGDEDDENGDEDDENGDEDDENGDEDDENGDEDDENGDEDNENGDEDNEDGDEDNEDGDKDNEDGDEDNEDGDEEDDFFSEEEEEEVEKAIVCPPQNNKRKSQSSTGRSRVKACVKVENDEVEEDEKISQRKSRSRRRL